MRDLAALGPRALGVLTALALASLATWTGVPAAWLWVASQVQAATDSFGLAVLALVLGGAVTLAVALRALGALTRRYQRARVARGLDDTGNFPLEVTLVLTAGVAVIAFVLWFGFLAGSPLPR